MSKFCENCGAEMDDNQVVCPNCGNGAEVAQETTTTQTVNTNTTSTSTSSDKKDTIKKVGIIAGAVAVVVVIISIIASIIGSGYKKPIENIVKGMNKGDSDIYLKAYPDFLKMNKTVDDDYLKKMKKEDEDDDNYGDNVKYSVKFLKKTKYDKKDLEYVVDYVKEKYDEKVKITAGYKVKVEKRTKGKKDFDYGTSDYNVYKVDGKWYVLPISPEDAKEAMKNK